MGWQDGTAPALPDGAEIERSAHLELEPDPQSVRRARAFVVEQLAALGDDDLCETAALLTSELATNAVIHARTDLVVAVQITADHVAVTVHDLDLGRQEQPGDRDGGRGLHLVRSLSCASGQDRHARGGGKTSWFRLCRGAHVGHPAPSLDVDDLDLAAGESA